MGAIPSNKSSIFPFTSTLPFIDKVIDPTTSKIKKIAIVLFATLALIPLAITLITLSLDGVYYIASCLYRNLATKKVAKEPTAAQKADPVNLTVGTAPVLKPNSPVGATPPVSLVQSATAAVSIHSPEVSDSPAASLSVAPAAGAIQNPSTFSASVPEVISTENLTLLSAPSIAVTVLDAAEIHASGELVAVENTSTSVTILISTETLLSSIENPSVSPAPEAALDSAETYVFPFATQSATPGLEAIENAIASVATLSAIETPASPLENPSVSPAPEAALDTAETYVFPFATQSATPALEATENASVSVATLSAIETPASPIENPSVSPAPEVALESAETYVFPFATQSATPALEAREDDSASIAALNSTGTLATANQSAPSLPGELLDSTEAPNLSGLSKVLVYALFMMYLLPHIHCLVKFGLGNRFEEDDDTTEADTGLSLKIPYLFEQTKSSTEALPVALSSISQLGILIAFFTRQKFNLKRTRNLNAKLPSQSCKNISAVNEGKSSKQLLHISQRSQQELTDVPPPLLQSEEIKASDDSIREQKLERHDPKFLVPQQEDLVNQQEAKGDYVENTPAVPVTTLSLAADSRLPSGDGEASLGSSSSAVLDQMPSVNRLEEISTVEKRDFSLISDDIKRLLFEPGNLDKGKKYAYSLYIAKRELDTKFPGWEEKLLPRLADLSTKSAFANRAYCVLNALKDSGTSAHAIRITYGYIIIKLREALARAEEIQAPELQQAYNMLQHFCHYKFTRVGMYTFLEDFISKALQAKQQGETYRIPESFTLHNLATLIKQANERLSTVPAYYLQTRIAMEYKKFKGTLGFGFDPTADSNTPWVHSIQTIQTANGIKIRTVLRHGTPTRDPDILRLLLREAQNVARQIPFLSGYISSPEQAVVIPEYKAHLRSDLTKISLYVNHQEHDEEGLKSVHGESDRSRAIQQLEDEHSNFHFLALPLDGPIWERRKLNAASIELLKEKIIHSIQTQTNGFALPKFFNTPSAESRKIPVKQILDQVHTLYFDNRELNTVEEKKTFLMLFYSELKEYVCEALQIDFLVFVCKDAKDRGNASTTVDMIKNLVLLRRENDSLALREVFFSALGPFIIKNEQIIPERLELALLVIEHLSALSEEQKQAIRLNSTIRALEVPKEKTSWSEMIGAQPFLDTIRGMREAKEEHITYTANFDQNIGGAFMPKSAEQPAWNTPKLREQIEVDLHRKFNIKLNGQDITKFDTLCEKLDIDLKFFSDQLALSFIEENPKIKRTLQFMILLQQGATAVGVKAASLYLNNNQAGFVVSHSGIAPQIDATFDPNNQDALHYSLITQMAFCKPGDKDMSYPIIIVTTVDKNFKALISWKFSG